MPRWTQTAHERFDAKWQPCPETGCWLWYGTMADNGYGLFFSNGRMVRAHRFAYERWIGPIPDGLDLDHLCRTRCCVNPDHVEPVTRRENLLRGEGHTAVNATKTHCTHGHEFTPENTYTRADGTRRCRACNREYMEGYNARKSGGVTHGD